MARITIDGRSFSGSHIQITGSGNVVIDGVTQEDTLQGRVEIHVVEGVIDNLEVDGDVHCGAVSGYVDAGGNVTCGNVGGYVDAGGNVVCGAVGGYVDAGGNVASGDVQGDIDAGGKVSITRRA
jgi:hypothetical protein